MDKYALYIAFAYGVTAVAISALVLLIIADYRRLRSALEQFPAREGDSREQ